MNLAGIADRGDIGNPLTSKREMRLYAETIRTSSKRLLVESGFGWRNRG